MAIFFMSASSSIQRLQLGFHEGSLVRCEVVFLLCETVIIGDRTLSLTPGRFAGKRHLIYDAFNDIRCPAHVLGLR